MTKPGIYLKLTQLSSIHSSSSSITTSLMSKKSYKKSQRTENTKAENESSIGPITKTSKGEILIKVQAKPGSKLDSVTDISSEGVGIQISAAPVDGEANATLVKYMAKILEVRKSDVTLDKGSKSRSKIVNVASAANLTVDDVKSKLQREMDSNK